jgi:hypothetical protein
MLTQIAPSPSGSSKKVSLRRELVFIVRGGKDAGLFSSNGKASRSLDGVLNVSSGYPPNDVPAPPAIDDDKPSRNPYLRAGTFAASGAAVGIVAILPVC